MDTSKAKQFCEASGIAWFEASDAQQLASQLAVSIISALQHDLETKGVASLVVSGGSTPAPVFKCLSVVDIDWSKVTVTLADERWVPPGHADSNESLVKDTLLVNKAATAKFVSLYRADMTPEQAISHVAADVLAMAQPFSATILGMGGDGHTASLFPDAPAAQLANAMALDNTTTIAVLAPPSVNQLRISLTRAALLNSKKRFLHITGEGKRDVLANALLECTTNNSAANDDTTLQPYAAGMKPIVGLLTSEPKTASVFWSP